MSVYAIGMMRDEIDMAETVVRHTLRHVDGAIFLDNGSVDGTSEVLAAMVRAFGGRLEVRDDPEVGYYQATKMLALADELRERGVDWVLPVDADEIFSVSGSNLRIGDVLDSQPRDIQMLHAHCYHHGPTGADDPTEPIAPIRQRWRNTTEGMPKCAVRLDPGLVLAMGNHGAWYDERPPVVTTRAALKVNHYPARSPEQYLKKIRNGAAAMVAAPDLSPEICSHWRALGELSDDEIVAQFQAYYVDDPASDENYHEDPAPLRR